MFETHSITKKKIVLQGILTTFNFFDFFDFVFRKLFGNFFTKPVQSVLADGFNHDNDVNERTPALDIIIGNASLAQPEVDLPMPSAPPPSYEESLMDQPPPYTEASAPPINPHSK